MTLDSRGVSLARLSTVVSDFSMQQEPATGNWRLPTADAKLPTQDSKLATAPRLLVVRLGSLGDLIHTLPAVAMLRQWLPQAFIGWVVEQRWVELLCSRPDLCGGDIPLSPEKPLINAIHTVTTRVWRRHPLSRNTRKAIAQTIRDLRRTRYDLALDFQSAIRSAVLGRLARPHAFIGFSRAHEAPASLFYTRRVEAQGRHMVEQNASLLRAVGDSPSALRFQNDGRRLTADGYLFPLPHDSRHDQWASDQLQHLGIRDFCLLNAGAGWGAKIWPSERWAEVARALAAHGLPSVINYGPGEEELARGVESESGGAAFAVNSSIGQLIALARLARVCVGGDTGPTHLAAALGIPVVAIFGPTDPARNGPFAPSSSPANIVVLRSETSITDHARRREPEPGLLEISPQQVITAALRVLDK